MMRGATKAVQMIMKMIFEGKRGRRRYKGCLDTIENNMRAASVCIGNVESRDKWTFRLKVANPK